MCNSGSRYKSIKTVFLCFGVSIISEGNIQVFEGLRIPLLEAAI